MYHGPIYLLSAFSAPFFDVGKMCGIEIFGVRNTDSNFALFPPTLVLMCLQFPGIDQLTALLAWYFRAFGVLAAFSGLAYPPSATIDRALRLEHPIARCGRGCVRDQRLCHNRLNLNLLIISIKLDFLYEPSYIVILFHINQLVCYC